MGVQRAAGDGLTLSVILSSVFGIAAVLGVAERCLALVARDGKGRAKARRRAAERIALDARGTAMSKRVMAMMDKEKREREAESRFLGIRR